MNVFDNFSQITTRDYSRNNSTKIEQSNSKNEYKPDILDIFSEKVVNKKDIDDMVTTPRAIFKGYLCFTAGTTLNAIASLLKDNKFSKGLKIAGSIISIYGTYNFVKPYLIRDKNLTKTKK